LTLQVNERSLYETWDGSVVAIVGDYTPPSEGGYEFGENKESKVATVSTSTDKRKTDLIDILSAMQKEKHPHFARLAVYTCLLAFRISLKRGTIDPAKQERLRTQMSTITHLDSLEVNQFIESLTTGTMHIGSETFIPFLIISLNLLGDSRTADVVMAGALMHLGGYGLTIMNLLAQTSITAKVTIKDLLAQFKTGETAQDCHNLVSVLKYINTWKEKTDLTSDEKRFTTAALPYVAFCSKSMALGLGKFPSIALVCLLSSTEATVQGLIVNFNMSAGAREACAKQKRWINLEERAGRERPCLYSAV